MKELAKAYIEKRIQTTRTKDTDYTAATMSNGSGKSQAEHAQDWAQDGQPTLTASYLNQAMLPVSQKGEILAEAYSRDAERTENLARYSELDIPELAASYRREARQTKKVAQGLTRAAQRSQNS